MNAKHMPTHTHSHTTHTLSPPPPSTHPTPPHPLRDVILYSRAEIHQENTAHGMAHLNQEGDAPWGIVRVKVSQVSIGGGYR